ncbi:MAG: methionine--tRNA ligase [Victivallales bacterium]|nr:methionine--tRNA ligase [Victivallales bacterium]
MNENNFYITTPIYYVNDRPHIGHAYTTILADTLARYHRLLGVPTHFLTGTDEHGQKVQNAAAKCNTPPLDYCDKVILTFSNLWKDLNITNDDFIRTTQERHKQVVSQILQNLYDKGEIYKAAYSGWYCVGCEAYITEKDVKCGESGNEHLCPNCNRALEQRNEESYYFKMGQYQDRLIQYIQEHPEFIQPTKFRNETLGFLTSKDSNGNRNKLNDLCIGRPKERLSWGIPLPFDNNFVTYVWFDALVNYISAIGYLRDEEEFSKWWPVNFHLIGKDILKPHTVYWPTMLMAMGLPLPKTVFVHGWWLTNDTKMSKSLGNVIDPREFLASHGCDALRYYLSAAMTIGQDANFTRYLFNLKYNSDLANTLGNLVNRAFALLEKFNGGFVPEVENLEDEASAELREKTIGVAKALGGTPGNPGYIDKLELDRALADVMAAVRAGNAYVDSQKPWVLAKEGKVEEQARIIRNLLEGLRIVSGLLYPVMPAKMTELRLALGLSQDEVEPVYSKLTTWSALKPGSKVTKIPPLFPRIDYEAIWGPVADDAEPKAEKPVKKEKKAAEKPQVYEPVTIEDFNKVRLVTAQILAAEHIEGAKKLLKLQISTGEGEDETRQIVSGIAEWYTPEQLVGKSIVIVANLKPVELRKVKSFGMLLAAKFGENLRLVTLDGSLPPGSAVG